MPGLWQPSSAVGGYVAGVENSLEGSSISLLRMILIVNYHHQSVLELGSGCELGLRSGLCLSRC